MGRILEKHVKSILVEYFENDFEKLNYLQLGWRFIMYINDMKLNSKDVMFADDSVLITSHPNVQVFLGFF